MNYSFREIFKEEKPFVGVITIKSAHLIDALDKEDYIKKVKDYYNIMSSNKNYNYDMNQTKENFFDSQDLLYQDDYSSASPNNIPEGFIHNL